MPKYTNTQFFNIWFSVTSLLRYATVIRLLPVKSSAPHITTSISPTGNTAAPANFERPTFSTLWDIMPLAKAPKAIKAPANMPNSTIWDVLREHLPLPTPIMASAMAAGAKKRFSMGIIAPFI